MTRNYFYIDKQNSFEDEISLCIEKISSKSTFQTPIGVTFFINSVDNTDFFEKRELIHNLLSKEYLHLPFSVISQSAGEGTTIEIWTEENCSDISYKNFYGINYTLYENSLGKFLWAFGLSSNNPDAPFRKQSIHSFELMQNILLSENFTMDDLLRQWNYIPSILKTDTENGKLYQNYQLFNDTRQYYYAIYKRNASYPAATGIGMNTGPVTIDFLAMKKKGETNVSGIKNPKQQDAYHYGQEVLVGSPLNENDIKKAPLFERAKYLGEASEGFVFISGTASIIGEKTIGIDDISQQLQVTADNISNLVTDENLDSIGVNVCEKRYSYLRVYAKNTEEMDAVKAFCRKRYGEIPILYVLADICRDDLLVEIEGEMNIQQK